jgi:nitrogen fixation protein
MAVSKFLSDSITLHNTWQQSSEAMPQEHQIPCTTESPKKNAKFTYLLDK